MTYTTVKTTTHTTSTKCQYIDRTSTRSACCFVTSPRSAKISTDRKSQQADGYVKRMQADQGVVGRPKQVGLDGQALVIDQVAPLAKRAGQEDRSQNDGQKPPQGEGNHSPSLEQLDRKVNRQAAGEQADRQKDGSMQHVVRLGPGEALADVKNVGDHEDGEDRGLGGDQAVHPHWAALGSSIGQRLRALVWMVRS